MRFFYWKGESMATVYGPATGNYSSQSIRTARKTGGSGGSKLTQTSTGWQYTPDTSGYEERISGNALGSRALSNSGANSYYNDYLSQQQEALRQAQKAQEEAARQRTQAAVYANNAYIPQVNAQTDKQLQQAYISAQQAKSSAPQSLAAMGYTGGATESSLLGLDTNYQNQRNNLETSRNTSLDQIRQNANQIQASGDASLADLASQYYSQNAAAAANAAQMAQQQSNWQAQFDAQQKAQEKQDFANTANAYYSNFQARINTLQNDGDTSNDWQIPILQANREQKILDQQELARQQAQQTLENAQNQQQIDYQTGKPYYNPKTGTGSKSSTKKYTPSQIQSMFENGWIDEATARSMLGV